MQEKIMQAEGGPDLDGWEGLAKDAQERIAHHRKAAEDHQKRIRTLTKSLRFFEEQIKNKEPWIRD